MAPSSTIGCVKWPHNPWLLLDSVMITSNDSQEIIAHIITVRPSFEIADNRQMFEGSFWCYPKVNLSSFAAGG